MVGRASAFAARSPTHRFAVPPPRSGEGWGPRFALSLYRGAIVLDDRWLALIKVKQIRRQFPLYGTELQAEDYREPPAHYFGVPAVGVRDAQELERAVTQALAASGPTVIEAVVDSDHYVETVYD